MRIEPLLLALALLAALKLQPSSCLAQGSLSPPGAPAPTMKTLAQIEPRTPISTAPFNISLPGSYYLTTNLTVSTGNAITIAVSGVTLDLGGFTISSTAPGAVGYGIVLGNNLSDLAIFNGHIRSGVTNNGNGVYSGIGFACGIYSPETDVLNTRVTDVSVAGCSYYGIYLGGAGSTVVESCTVRTLGSDGIVAGIIKTSVAEDCGGNGIYGKEVADSRGESSLSGDGLFAQLSALNSFGASAGGYGLVANIVQNCYGSSGTGTGLSAFTAQNCYAYTLGGTGTGLLATSALNCHGETYGSGTGLSATSAQNCYGWTSGTGTGLSTTMAVSSYGYSSSSGYGLFAGDIAIGCRGHSASGTGLHAYIASSCRGTTTSGTAQDTPNKYNMP
jgi:hypothetical protein